jgi:DNA-directed RNA polymerase specialized sigma24 family protein
MMGTGATTQNDALLVPFLSAASEGEAETCLTQLLKEQAEPIIRGITRQKFQARSSSGAGGQGSETEDIHGEVLVQLLGRLYQLKADPLAQVISDFRGYVAVTAYHVCYAHLRRLYPERRRLKNRLRYLLSNSAEFAIRESVGDNKEWLCGFAGWPEKSQGRARAEQLQRVLDDENFRARVAQFSFNQEQGDLASLLKSLFEELGGAVELDALVNTVAELQGIKDRPARDTRDDENESADASEQLADTRTNIATELEQRLYLQRLWAEILELPGRQRSALLLNLKIEGESVITLLPLIGIASIRQIAEAVSIPAEQFAAMWNDLPLEDAVIARHLSVTRQQVINLRKSARERLARHMRIFG